MKSASLFQLITFLFSHLTMSSGNNHKFCKTDESVQENGTFLWRDTSDSSSTNFVISTPLCLDKNGQPKVRKCSTANKEWIPEKSPQCHRFQNKSPQNTICPEDLIEIPVEGRALCMKVSNQTHQWSDRMCLGSTKIVNYLDDCEREKVFKYLQTQHVKSFWIPVKRAYGNKYNPFVWKLPGRIYGEAVTNLHFNETTDKNCLVNKVTPKFDVEMSHCEERHHVVCFLKLQHLVIKSACPKNYAAMSYKPHVCFGIDQGINRLTSISQYLNSRNAIYHILNAIDLDHDHSEYFLLKKLFETSLGSHFILMNFKEEMKIGLANQSNEYFGQKIISEKAAIVEMFLKFNEELDALMLTVYNRNFIWKTDEKDYGINCFGVLPFGAIVPLVSSMSIFWESPDQWKTMIKLDLVDDGPNYYWCEAHSVFNFTKIQSEGIVATKQTKGHTFAIFFDLPCVLEQCQRIRENSEYFGKQIVEVLQNTSMEMEKFKLLQLHSVRIAKVESVEEHLSRITFLCHVTASLDDFSLEENNEVSNEDNKDRKENDWNSHVKLRNLLSDLIKLYNGRRSSVNSTEFCFQEDLPDSPNNYWLPVVIGQNSTTKDLCLQINGLPVSRRCVGSFIYGAMWEETDNMNTTCTQTDRSEVTSQLYEIDHSQRASTNPEETIKDVRDVIDRNVKTIIPADVFYLSKILQSVANENLPLKLATNTTHNKTEEMANDVISSYSSLMEVSENVMRLSARLNTTNVLLDALEKVVDETMAFQLEPSLHTTKSIDKNNSHKNSDMINHPVDGVRVLVAPNLVVFSIDPRVANVTGLALYKIDSSSRNTVQRRVFEDNVYKFLYSNQSAQELLENKDLLSATFIPNTLLFRLDEIFLESHNLSLNHPQIVIKIFANDVLFQEDRNVSANKVDGKIISISIPGHNHDLPELLPLIMRFTGDANGAETSCRYWNYQTWAQDGLLFKGKSSSNNLVWCGSSHLTQFAFLVGGSNSLKTPSIKALDTITLFGCLLSLIGVSGIFITATTLSKWRRKDSSKFLIQLSVAILLQMILFSFVNYEYFSNHFKEINVFTMCVGLGACLQYSVLAQFSWMMIIAYAQYIRYVKVFHHHLPNQFFLKSMFIGWGLPLIPVALVVGLDRQSFIPFKGSDSAICYPSGRSLYLGVILPLAMVIFGNLLVYVVVISSLAKTQNNSAKLSRARMTLPKVRVSVLLFFLLGLTWIFGLLASITSEIVFSYLFSLTATLQGFFLFVYFIILDPETRRMWMKCLGFEKERPTKRPKTTKALSETHAMEPRRG